jgi:hypothetical protein
MARHEITFDNYKDAEEAIRYILMMYVEMAEAYSGFGHAIDVNIPLALKYVDADLITPAGTAPLIDLDLLRIGSGIGLLCFVYDFWSEHDSVNLPRDSEIRSAIEGGRLAFVPDVERVAREAIQRDYLPQDDPWFDQAVEPIYQRYVVGYFERLSRMHRRPGGDDGRG